MEIKLVEATKKFGKENYNFYCSVEIEEYAKDSTIIRLRDFSENTSVLWIFYKGNGEEGQINARRNDFSIKKYSNYLKEYKEFLSQEVPEIKDRIVIKG